MIYFARIYVCSIKSTEEGVWPISLIKIGCTSQDVRNRIWFLRSRLQKTVELLATMPGGYPEEAELHQRFSGLRIGGKGSPEWFFPAVELMDFIREVKNNSGHGLDVVMSTV